MTDNFSQQISQIQTQQLAPAQLQSLQLLASPLAELESILSSELASNPLLEIAAPGREELAGDPIGEAAAAGNELQIGEFEGDREDFPILETLVENWREDSASHEFNSFEDIGEMQKRRDYQFESLTAPRTLLDILYEQLDFCDLTNAERHAAELIIGSLNEHGFLSSHIADIAMCGNLDLEQVEKALRLVQSFDPPGVGARDAAESLLLQLKRRNYPDERIYRLLNEFRDELERNQLPQIAKAMKIPVEEIYSMLEVLKKLNCVPAAGLSSPLDSSVIIPEMTVELENNEPVVHGRENTLPKLRLVSCYLKMLEDPATPPETAKYLQEKLASAEILIKSLELRQSTIRRITDVIARRQADFFRYGPEFLQPMTMQETARELDLHETTISRAVSGKYLDTPQGLLEYRFFFSGGYKNTAGQEVSSHGVKALIRQLIESEDPAKPLSDAAIADQLAQQGLSVARRTVAKYRESMNIAPTNLRRHH